MGGISEADGEGILSMQRHVTELPGTRFELPSVEARLKEWGNQPTQVRCRFWQCANGKNSMTQIRSNQLRDQLIRRNTLECQLKCFSTTNLLKAENSHNLLTISRTQQTGRVRRYQNGRKR
jgi:hypothetical protein